MEQNIGTLRLQAQRVIGKKLNTPQEVVRWMGAIQAQDYGQALWAIGARLDGATIKDVEKAIADGAILRTWPMRGTIHFVPAEDAKWMIQLTASRMLAADRLRQKQLGITEHIIEHARGLFYKALKGGRRLTRPSMMQLLESQNIQTGEQRGYHILFALAQSGMICLGPLEGKQQTFVLLDEWAPKPRQLSREESLVILAKRYFTSHGPATIADFANWTKLTIADAKRGLEPNKHILASETINGVEYWRSPSTDSSNSNDQVILLPSFEEFLLGYKDRTSVLDPIHIQQVVPGKNGIFHPIMVLDGRVIGGWRRIIKPKTVDISLLPFAPLKAKTKQQALHAAETYSQFLGLPIGKLTI